MITPPPPLSKYGTSKEFVAKKEREREISKAIKKCFINQVAQAKWKEMTKSKYRRKKLQIMIK